MATPADLTNPKFREAMEKADKLLDDGDYNGASRHLAETYLALMETRPDLSPIAPAHPGVAAPRNARQVAWPPTGGVVVVEGDNGKAALKYVKERFSMTEALGYYEFMMNLLWGVQNNTIE